jgi:hypothetical protein
MSGGLRHNTGIIIAYLQDALAANLHQGPILKHNLRLILGSCSYV